MSTCRETMTHDPIFCEPGDPVSTAADLMRRHNVGSLPVVDSAQSRRLVGIVTDRDLVVKVVAGNRSVDTATVRDAMTANPFSCQEEDDLESAIATMSERKVRRLPVVDGEGRLVGIVAQADVATRHRQDRQTGELVEAISEPSVARNEWSRL